MPNQDQKLPKADFFYRNGLSIVFFSMAALFLFAQAGFGWFEHNEDLADKGQAGLSFWQYLGSGHFIQATFENWESEFLQMALFVLFTVFLRQMGSSESKPLFKKSKVDEEPKPKPDSPWPVRKGGLALKLYAHSLSIALFALFALSLVAHFLGSWKDYRQEQELSGKESVSMLEFWGHSKFWFESFQNWQSEFLSVGFIVVLSVYLREKGSSQSKPVDAAHYEDEE